MSQHTIYKCDHCKREIGRKVHITLAIGSNGITTGIAVPPPAENRCDWSVVGLPHNFLHFHDGKCIGAFFDELIKKQSLKAKKK